jgi:hypothetical protein
VQFASNGHMLSSLPSSLLDIPSRKEKLIIRGQQGKTNCGKNIFRNWSRLHTSATSIASSSPMPCSFKSRTLNANKRDGGGSIAENLLNYKHYSYILINNAFDASILLPPQTCRYGLSLI